MRMDQEAKAMFVWVARRKATFALVTTAVSAAVLAGATPADVSRSSASAPVLVYGINSVASNVSPIASGGTVYLNPLGLETLMKLGPNGQPQPNLAQSVGHPTGVTYIYHLRRGVKFWDGNEMTSADVANAINYARFPSFITSAYFTNVKSVKATARYTVTITLKRPDAAWEWTLTQQGFVFEKKFQDQHRATMGNPGTLIEGTGPFKFDSLDPTSGAELSANPNYWGGKVRIKHISVKFFSSDTNAALAFRAGALDVYFPADPHAFQATSGTAVKLAPGISSQYFSMDTQARPWSDVHVRRAVAYALNRKDLIQAATGGIGSPNYTIIPYPLLRTVASKAEVNALIRSLPTYRHNLAEAKKELAKSAYPQGFEAPLYTFTFGTYVQTNQVIVDELAQIGIKLDLTVVPLGQYVQMVYSGGGHQDKYGAMYSRWIPLSPDLGYIPELGLNGKRVTATLQNMAAYSNPKVDRLLIAGDSTADPAKRFAAYSAILRIVAADVPYVPLFAQPNAVVLSNKFKWPSFNAYSSNRLPFLLQLGTN
jgi:peptide/nickel transport system substrate-binding protein